MILRIRNGRTFKGVCMLLALTIFTELVVPTASFALTGGPSQPEFSSFTPIGTSDMVDLSSGDMSYNIPLMDVGGYPLNIAYSSGVGMDDEASWVGLGWNLSVGQINRNVRGIPDDFNGDEMIYEDFMKPNITAGANFKFSPNLAGVPVAGALPPESDVNLSLGVAVVYNNYTGPSIKQSAGITVDLTKQISVGMNVESGPDGLSISPNLSLHAKAATKKERDKKSSASVGIGFNSRQGLGALTIGANLKRKNTKDAVTKKGHQGVSGSIGSSIGFAEELYTPSKRVAMDTKSFTFNAALGAELFAVEGQGQITGFGTIMKIKNTAPTAIPAYGYSNTENGQAKAILDFNREKEGNFSVNSTNLPVTNYTYDIYSVQGQGVSGMYRPYRNQVGYVYDSEIEDGSTSGSVGIEIGTGNAFHAGIDLELTTIKSKSGLWLNDNYMIPNLTESGTYNANYEKVHYKNVGDLTSDRDYSMFTNVGDYGAVRVSYVGDKFNRYVTSKFMKKSTWNGGESEIGVGNSIKRTKRQLRNQAINNITIGQMLAGLGYSPYSYGMSSSTLSSSKKNHHIGEVQIIRNDGARYIYGYPTYNTKKIEATFSVDGTPDCNTGLVHYNASKLVAPYNQLPNDKFLNKVTTPAFVNAHLLSSILSTDYQDKTGNGPTSDDYGTYTKFSYDKKSNYKWRVPYSQNKANYNEGLKTDVKDDQGNFLYGEKEQVFIKKIETKTHVAIFQISQRDDAFGVDSENGSPENTVTGSVSYKLDKILLYSAEEVIFDANGNIPSSVLPIKVVNFVYDYALCKGVPNNKIAGQGKLTLKKIFFEYRGSKMGKYTGYNFDYNESLAECNPNYNLKGYDTWGNYKSNIGGCANFGTPNALEFPYTNQELATQDINSCVWTLRKISLPSGGEISLNYESDRYNYVQNLKSNRMFFVRGAGVNSVPNSENLGTVSSTLYSLTPNKHSNYLYVQVDDNEVASNDANSIYKRYVASLDKQLIYFRFLMNMTMEGGLDATLSSSSKFDYVTGYCRFDETKQADLKITTIDSKKILVLPIMMVDKADGNDLDRNPISKAGWHFGRKYLSNHVYSNQPNGDSEDIASIIPELLGNITNLMSIFNGPNGELEKRKICRRFITKKSWVRLVEPNKSGKLGGGSRVKEVKISDKWADMTDDNTYQTMVYGQKYSYTDGDFSSGVATYEPIGNKENPFVQPVFSNHKNLLAPDEENYIEKPFGESFFPNPQVTYSKVSVSTLLQNTNIPTNIPNAKVKNLHRTGSVVNEFYTSKDFPTIVDQTKLETVHDKTFPLASLLKIKIKKHITASQGYVVHLNDMNGKQKAQRVFAEGQSSSISGVDYIYNSHPAESNSIAGNMNRGLLNNNVKVIDADGTISNKTIGVETDVINDFRQNKTVTKIKGMNTNLAAFVLGVIPILLPIPLPDATSSEDQFRSVSTTKVINTFGLLKATIAYDAGATVITKNMAWDAVTGEVLVTETVDEFDDNYYTMNYPAHWYYRGMAQASRNLGLKGTLSAGSGGIHSMLSIAPYVSSNFLIDGDEIFINNTTKAWVTNVSGNTFKLINQSGGVINSTTGSNFIVYRSGHRNLQSAGVMNVTLKQNPLLNPGTGEQITQITPSFLNGANWKIINAGAVDYASNWKAGCECASTPLVGSNYNPFVENERGVWRTKSSRTYLAGRAYNSVVNPRTDGYFERFAPMYKMSSSGNWLKDFTDWTYVAEVSKYSPYGFELENKDALDRYSSAQYGYNNTFPMAVGANSEYRQMGFDGFEDHIFIGCPTNSHFSFKGVVQATSVVNTESHTGRYSVKVGGNSSFTLNKILSCSTPAQP